MKWIRKQYIACECSHREYYGQFVDEGIIDYVVRSVGGEILLNSKDPHFNNISLKTWDILLLPPSVDQKLRDAGDYLTAAGKCCIHKEAARQFVNCIDIH